MTLSQVVSAHGRTPEIAGIQYSPPPGIRQQRDPKASIIDNLTHCVNLNPQCGETFMRWLFFNDQMPLLLPNRQRRDQLVIGRHERRLQDFIPHLGGEPVVYLLYSEVKQKLHITWIFNSTVTILAEKITTSDLQTTC